LSQLHPGSHAVTADGFILAGGHSSRMGQDKALITLAGTPLLQHALGILRNAGLDPAIAGARSDSSAFAPTLFDDPSQSGLGPLAGICTALASGTTPYAVFLPVDLPLLPASLIAYLVHHAEITRSAITLVSVAAFVETFPVVIDRSALPWLQSSLHSNDRNCLRAFREASNALSRTFSVLPVELLLHPGHISHPNGFPPALWFLNVNSPQDLVRAETLISSQLQVS
jgi:molybdopterin-guanine dinucleotide biosynthesis protein A